jgi:hypothetical protein
MFVFSCHVLTCLVCVLSRVLYGLVSFFCLVFCMPLCHIYVCAWSLRLVFVLSCVVMPCVVFSCVALCCVVLCCVVLCCPVLSCLVLSRRCLVIVLSLSCYCLVIVLSLPCLCLVFVLSCLVFVLSCLVWSFCLCIPNPNIWKIREINP